MADGLTTTTTVATIPSGSKIVTDDCGAAGHAQGVKLCYDADGVATFVTADANGLEVQLGAAIPAGTNAIGKLAANSGVDIGDVDVTSVIPGTGATNLGKAVDSAAGGTDTGVVMLQIRDDALTTLTPVDGDYTPDRCDSTGSKWVTLSAAAEVIGTTAHDSVDANAPVKIGAKAVTSVSALTMVANADRTDLFAGSDGVLITRPNAALEDVVSGTTSNTDGASTQVIAAGAAGIINRLSKFSIFNSSAAAVVVDIKDGTTVKWSVLVPAGGAAMEDFAANGTPLLGTAATAWNFDAASATSTLYYNATAFKSKV